jgi:hypothetical protein
MAILIQINRVANFSDVAIYEFGSLEGIVGRVSLDKASGQVELFDIVPGAAAQEGFYLPRVSRALALLMRPENPRTYQLPGVKAELIIVWQRRGAGDGIPHSKCSLVGR